MSNQTRIDQAIDALISDNAAEALGHLMLYKVGLIEAIKNYPIEVDVETAPHVLPPLTPLGDRGRQVIDFKCPTCGAKPGKPCVKVSEKGRVAKDGPKAMGEPLSPGKRHNARRQAWRDSQ